MNRSVTNAIRFVMDECLPPGIRDKKWFMKPMFQFWFKNQNIEQIMNFKSLVKHMSEDDFSAFYKKIDIKSQDRPTDMNVPTMNWFLEKIPLAPGSLLDVGCGRGYWLNELARLRPELDLTGLDFFESLQLDRARYVQGNAEKLPFPDNAFDIVTCIHTIEHLQDLPQALSELVRVARKMVLIATPRQRYYYYTLDLHVHFFPEKYLLTDQIPLQQFECESLGGDWAYAGYPQP